jgi:hypothetical protein
MGGKVFAESQLGEGTRINIDIGIKAIDTEFLQTQDQKSMSNQQKLSYNYMILTSNVSSMFIILSNTNPLISIFIWLN